MRRLPPGGAREGGHGMKTKEQQDFNDALAELRKLFGMEDEAGK